MFVEWFYQYTTTGSAQAISHTEIKDATNCNDNEQFEQAFQTKGENCLCTKEMLPPVKSGLTP